MSIKAVLFDVDGVLLDSTAANAAFYRELFRRIGGLGPTAEDMKTSNHLSMEAMLRRFYPDRPQTDIDAWVTLGDTIDVGFELLRLMPGVLEVIPQLSQRYALGLVTNRTTASIDDLWKILPFKNSFSAIAAYEMTLKHKPDPEPVQYALQQLDVQPSEAVFVGDAKTDLQAGQAAGVEVVILGQEHWSGAKATIGSLTDLPALLDL